MLTSRTIKTVIDINEYAIEKYEERKKILLEQYLNDRIINQDTNKELKFIIEQQMMLDNNNEQWKLELEQREKDKENDIEIQK